MEDKLIKLKVSDGGYSLSGKALTFKSNIGDIAMDLWSALEIAETLVDCVGLDYKKNSMQEVEEEIADKGVTKNGI